MDTQPVEPVIGAFVPLFLMLIVAVSVSIYLIKKKGKSMWLLILAFIPLVNTFLLVYLLAQTNQEVLDEIKELKNQLEKLGQAASSSP